MKGDPKVIELLNEALKNELTAINQYWLHYRMLDNWGVDKLAEYRAARIDRRDEARRSARRAHPVPRRLAQLPGARRGCASARMSRRCCKADLEPSSKRAKL